MDKRLRCWASDETERAPEGRFKAVSAGQGTSCAIRTSGTVVCWGWEPLGTPKGRYVAVSVTQGRACGILTSGRVNCWWPRENDLGERIADGSGTPALPDGRYVAVSLSDDPGGCALRDDGLLACWDEEDATPPAPAGRYRALGDGCAVTVDGEIECFRSAYWEGVGRRPEPLPGPFVAVDGDSTRGCALREDGTLACWGRGGSDDEGDDLPMPALPGRYTAVSVGEYYACALQADDHAICWGDDNESARPAPTAIVEVPNFVLGSSIPVTWRASPAFARITGYDVEYTAGPWTEVDDGDPTAPWTRWFTGTRRTRATLAGLDGRQYWLRVRAHDADGLVSDWTESYGTSLPLDDSVLESTGPWKVVRDDAYVRGTALRTTTRGATLLISPGGADGVIILATTCPDCGTFTLQYPSEDCAEDEQAAGTPPPSCPPDREDPIRTRGVRRASTVVFMGNNGQEGYAGPLELVVTSSGKPVTIDAVIFADTE